MKTLNVTNIDNRTIMPGIVEVTEKRAPTDESVKLLNEMQDKAASNIVCKISNNTDNSFKWEAYFMNVISCDFDQAGILVLNISVNGKRYEKKIKVKSGLMNRLGFGDFLYSEANTEVQRFLFLQISLVLGSILLEDSENFGELMWKLTSAGAVNFDYNTLADVGE